MLVLVSSEIYDLLSFVNHFASQSKEIRFGDYFFDVWIKPFWLGVRYPQQARLRGNNYNHWKILDLVLHLNYFQF